MLLTFLPEVNFSINSYMIKWISPNHLLAWFEDHNKTDGYILGRKNMASTAWSDTKPNKITSRFSNAYRLLDLEWWWVFAFLFHLYLNFLVLLFLSTPPLHPYNPHLPLVNLLLCVMYYISVGDFKTFWNWALSPSFHIPLLPRYSEEM